MADFMILFLIRNLFIAALTGLLLAARRLLRGCLSGRMQYRLWFVLLILLALPFLPVHLDGSLPWPVWAGTPSPKSGAAMQAASLAPFEAAGRIQDFTLSVTRKAPALWLLLAVIWLSGILLMLFKAAGALRRLAVLKRSASPLQNRTVLRLYKSCLDEMGIDRDIPVYSTAFLKSPILAGCFRPCIYLPIPLLTECSPAQLRCILLHELQHFAHRDILVNYLMYLAGTLYWFHPLVRYALGQMRCDGEAACDEAVLEMLPEESYTVYGETLICLAAKHAPAPSPFAAGISSGMKQMKHRILRIASYKRPSRRKKLRGRAVFCLTALLLLSFAPALLIRASESDRFHWDPASDAVSYTDLSDYFGKYEGSFVLYDPECGSWLVHDRNRATLRTSPDSTYKIYDALFALEQGIITPDSSLLSWNHETYPFDAWNADQDLYSAMAFSVNWYFQYLDEQLGMDAITAWLGQIGYGNEQIRLGSDPYWLESSLKISPVEQARLLAGLWANDLPFSPENTDAVKASLLLSSDGDKSLYGKTGTGRVNGQDKNGWFVGCLEEGGHIRVFAVNITADSGATGSAAARIALEILSDLYSTSGMSSSTFSMELER